MLEVVVAGCDKGCVEALESAIKRRPDAAEFTVRHVADAAGLEALLARGEALDILVIDVELGGPCVDGPQGSLPGGIDFVLRQLPAKGQTQVVYVGENPLWTTKSYRTPHVYFLVQPFNEDDLDDALEKACQNLRAAANRPLVVRCDGKIQAVAPHKINFIESDRRKLHIHTADGVVTTYATLDSVAHGLPSCFVRSHKSFLVNMASIETLDADHVVLQTGEAVPVSQKRRKATQEAFIAFTNRPMV